MFEELLFNVSQCKTVQEATDLLCRFIDEHSIELAMVKNSLHDKQSAPCISCGIITTNIVRLCKSCEGNFE